MQRNHAMGDGNRWWSLDKLILPKKSDLDVGQSFFCPHTPPGSTTVARVAPLSYSLQIGVWHQDLPKLLPQRDVVPRHYHIMIGNHQLIRFACILACIFVVVNQIIFKAPCVNLVDGWREDGEKYPRDNLCRLYFSFMSNANQTWEFSASSPLTSKTAIWHYHFLM